MTPTEARALTLAEWNAFNHVLEKQAKELKRGLRR
jgi:hypothetical protein